MEQPIHGNVKPAEWWRALLVVAYNCGMRRRTLFGLKWRDVDFRKRLITVSADISKSRKRQIIPMNGVVTAHLKAIQRRPEEYVFHCGWNWQRYRMGLFKLQSLAGIDKAERFQLHRLRKTCATVLWAKDPGAAQLMLGHASLAIARDHYVNAPSALVHASEAMPQPAWSET
jgi:integrase